MKKLFNLIVKIIEITIYTGVIIGILFVGYIAVNVSDVLFVAIVLILTLLMSYQFVKIYLGSKQILTLYFNADTIFHEIFNKKTIVTVILAVISSLFLSVTAYGISVLMIKESIFFFLVSSFIVILIVAFFINAKMKSKFISDTVKEPVANHLFNLAELFILAGIVNVVISVIYTIPDYHNFFTSNVTINNFDTYAVNNRIFKAEENDFSRRLFNAFILIDYFKQALTNTLVDVFYDKRNLNHTAVFIVIFVLNYLKYINYSIAIVILVQSINKNLIRLTKKISNLIEKQKGAK
jgi:hypothetical protein